MASRNVNIWKSIDWVTISIYVILVIFGWFSICGASYTYGETDFFDFSSRSGKQLVWILCSFGLGFVLLMLEDKFYELLAYFLYIGFIILLIVTIFIAPDVKGSRSWLQLGPVSIQPAEFAKFATALALAKFMNSYNFNINKLKNILTLALIFLLPMGLIILQKETGSALVYLAFFLVLYREGMPGAVLFSGVCAVLFFIFSIRFGDVYIGMTDTPVGEFLVLAMILIFSSIMIGVYCKKWVTVRNIIGISLLLTIIGLVISLKVYFFDVSWLLLAVCILFVGYLLFLALKERSVNYLLISIFALCSLAFLYSSDYVFNNILEAHQKTRIQVLLGMEDDLAGAGYNVNQSKIAIGSGGLMGKGFLNGTQTKLKYVPEQDTDFIFCTVGEEQGFIGTSVVLLIFLLLVLRLIVLAERQNTTFGRVYGYSVMSIFLFHIFINVGMVLGLTPVIGIPLPFFSYGGSSLWGFTILLFIFLRIDAGRKERL